MSSTKESKLSFLTLWSFCLSSTLSRLNCIDNTESYNFCNPSPFTFWFSLFKKKSLKVFYLDEDIIMSQSKGVTAHGILWLAVEDFGPPSSIFCSCLILGTTLKSFNSRIRILNLLQSASKKLYVKWLFPVRLLKSLAVKHNFLKALFAIKHLNPVYFTN